MQTPSSLIKALMLGKVKGKERREENDQQYSGWTQLQMQ